MNLLLKYLKKTIHKIKLQRTRTIIIILSIVLLFGIIRLLLPYAVLYYVTYKFNQIPGYRTHIADIDLHPYKESYVIKDIIMEKTTNAAPVPFFSAKTIELSMEWRALIKGSLVGQIKLNNPKVNFVVDKKGNKDQLAIDKTWQDVVKAIFPLKFNKIIVNNGQIHYRSFTSSPPFDISINNISATLDNLQNVIKTDNALTSTLQMHGTATGNGDVNTLVKFNSFKKQPTFILTIEIKEMDLSKAGNFLKNYTKLHAASGTLSIYIEAAAKDGKIVGYVKPLIKNLKIADEKNKTIFHAIYKNTVKAAAKILTNPHTKMLGTKVTFTGEIDNPNVSTWSLIVNIFRNAFIKALLPQIDRSILNRNISV